MEDLPQSARDEINEIMKKSEKEQQIKDRKKQLKALKEKALQPRKEKPIVVAYPKTQDENEPAALPATEPQKGSEPSVPVSEDTNSSFDTSSTSTHQVSYATTSIKELVKSKLVYANAIMDEKDPKLNTPVFADPKRTDEHPDYIIWPNFLSILRGQVSSKKRDVVLPFEIVGFDEVPKYSYHVYKLMISSEDLKNLEIKEVIRPDNAPKYNGNDFKTAALNFNYIKNHYFLKKPRIIDPKTNAEFSVSDELEENYIPNKEEIEMLHKLKKLRKIQREEDYSRFCSSMGLYIEEKIHYEKFRDHYDER